MGRLKKRVSVPEETTVTRVSPVRRAEKARDLRRFTVDKFREIKRRVDKGEPIAQIAREMGLSRQRVHQVLQRPNPMGEVRTYRCMECSGVWQSAAVEAPERCGVCGSYDYAGHRVPR